MIGFIITAQLILLLMYGYIWYRVIAPAFKAMWFRFVCLIWMVPAWATSSLPIVFRWNGWESPLSDTISGIIYLNLGMFSLIFVGALLLDSIKFGIKLTHKTQTNIQHERRQFLTTSLNAGMIGTSGILTGKGVINATQNLQVKEVEIPIHNLPAPLHKMRLVQFTDLHIGPTIKQEFVQEVVQTVQSLNPDAILMTGDLVDGSIEHLHQDVQPLKQLNAPLGKFFVTGNHEYYSGAEAWIEHIKTLGFDVLLNEHRLLQFQGIQWLLGGVTDYHADRYLASHQSDPEQSIQGAPATPLKVLMAHQPKSVNEAVRAGYDLQISGHTHGGQYYP